MRDLNDNQYAAVRDLWVRGIAAAKSGDYSDAKRYLTRVLDQPNCNLLDHSQIIKAWYWLSEAAEDPAEKRGYLEMVISMEPHHPEALRSLAVLDGQLDPREVINPDHLPSTHLALDENPAARRFTCSQCGGRLTYTPDGKTLICERCAGRQGIGTQQLSFDAQSNAQDFAVALATLQGHVRPSGQHDLRCPACGAPLAPDQEDLSVFCPYCASVFVLEGAAHEVLIRPQGVIPFALAQKQAVKALHDWIKQQRLKGRARLLEMRGFYLPTWMFMVALPGRSALHASYGEEQKLSLDGAAVLVPASRALPEEWANEVNRFNLQDLAAYDPSYLAAWPAETYQVSLSDASLAARLQALKQLRAIYAADKRLTSMDLVINTYKLILLPFWSARYRAGEYSGAAFINGQTGSVCAKPLTGGFLKQLTRVLGLDEDDNRDD